MVVVGVLIYGSCWALYASGDSVLLAPLLDSGGARGSWVAPRCGLQRFMGIETAQTALDDGSDETEQ